MVAGVSNAIPPATIETMDGVSICIPSAVTVASNPDAFQNRVVDRTRWSCGASMNTWTLTWSPTSSSS